MRKAILMLLLLTTPAYAENTAKVEVRGESNNGTATVMATGIISKVFTQDDAAIQQQTISATASAFTQFTVPTGAKAVLIDVGTSPGLRLKGVTGDNGISLDGNTPVLIGISDEGSTIGIQNQQGTARNLKVYFF